MPFETDVLIDNRSFFQMYKAFLYSKHIILCLILNNTILLKYIKFSVFIMSTATDFFFNAFFYSDEYISKSFQYEGSVAFFITLPKSIISYLATALFTFFLEYLTSSKFLVLFIKSEFKDKFYSKCNSFINMLQCKIKVYFVIAFIFITFFWYYVTAFCAVYQNSQADWIESTFLSFGISMFSPFVTCLIGCACRFLALKYKSKCWFKISNIILFLI